MDQPTSRQPQSTAATWIAHWRNISPQMDAVRRQELRRFDHNRQRASIDALLEIGAAHAVPRTSSGLVELQRRLQRLYS